MALKTYVVPNGKDDGRGQDSDVDDANDDEEVDVRCGYGRCKPESLQKCNNPKILLVFMCIFVVTQGFVVNGLNNVNTQSIERRFRLPSSKSGLISSSYDFSAAVIGVFISFMGSGRHKSRWLTAGAICLGLGSLTMALPHFTTGLYDSGQGVSGDTCRNATSDHVEVKCVAGSLQQYLGVLMFGMILHGVGGCIAYTVGVGYLDDSVKAEKSPLYLGFLYGAAALGPGLGYIIGGQLLNVYVDFDKVDTSTITLTPDDPRWVGAWWAGFFFSVIISFLVAIPLSCFGAEMPSAQKIRDSRVSQMHNGIDDPDAAKGSNHQPSIKEFPKATLALLKNLPFVFTMLAGATEGILTSGFATFVPKYIQNHFNVSSGTAALYTGIAAVPGAAGGMFVGGFICSKMKLKVGGMFKFSIITCLISIVSMNFLWISCDHGNFAGVSTPYFNGSKSLTDTCNKDCGCDTRYFKPVCSGGVQFFSACHAGCSTFTADNRTYGDCACVAVDPSTSESEVQEGLCNSGCGMLYLFLVLLFFVIFITFLPSTPSDAATLRCIHADHRTFSMGLKWLFIRLLGTVPGPVIFGAVTDTACSVWQTECGEESSCWIYDNFAVSRNYFLVAMAAKALSMTFFSLAFCLYKPPDCAPSVTIGTNDDRKKQMSFENGSFRASEFEGSVLGVSKRSETDRTTNL